MTPARWFCSAVPALAGAAQAVRALAGAAQAVLALAGAAQAAEAPWTLMPAPVLPARLPITDEGAGWTIAGQAARFEASDATPVATIGDDRWDRYSPRRGRNVALQAIRVELAAQTRGWEVAGLVHSDIVIRGSRDTYDLLHDYKQRLTPAPDSRFALDADANGTVWAGLRGARSWRSGPLALTAGVTLLSVQRVQRSQLKGSAGYSVLGGYSVQADGVRQDSYRRFEGFGESYGDRHSRGSGWTSELGLAWQPWDGAFVNLSVSDLFSHVRVDQVATQQIHADSATASFDADGYVNYAPLLTGRYASVSVRGRLPRKASLAFGSVVPELGGLMLGGRWEQVAGIAMPSAWASVPLPLCGCEGTRLQFDADLRFHALGIGLQLPRGTLMLRSSSPQWARAQARGWTAAFSWPL